MTLTATYDYIKKKAQYNKKVRKLCEPLKQRLGIDHFHHTFITHDHRYFGLNNNTEMSKSYIDNEVYRCDPFVNRADASGIPNVCMPLFIISQQAQDEEAKFAEWANVAGLNHPLIIKRETNDGYEITSFYNESSSQSVINIYLNNLPMLIKFIEHFKSETTQLTNNLRDFSIDLSKAIGDEYFNASNMFLSNKKIIQTAPTLPVEEDSTKITDTLTRREKECVMRYVRNQTAKNIATGLGISIRTVEKHIDNARQKLGCKSKLELFKKLVGLNDFVYIA